MATRSFASDAPASVLPNLQPKADSCYVTGALLDVAIIGGGLAGLALAKQLLAGDPSLKIKVFERDANMEARKQGYGLTLSNTPVLKKLGLE